jgi:hypothetical protein
MAENAAALPLDFVDLLAAFGRAEVRYLVIGGYAVGYHDRPRTTPARPQPENIDRACRALLEFGADVDIVHVDIVHSLKAAVEDEVVWMGHPPLRVDLLEDAPGVIFATAWSNRVVST